MNLKIQAGLGFGEGQLVATDPRPQIAKSLQLDLRSKRQRP
jgi:hypothetical protein